MKKYLLLGLFVLLTGCSSISNIMNNDTKKAPVSKTETDTTEKMVVCSGNEDTKITLEAKGDSVQNMKQVSYASFDQMGVEMKDGMDKSKIQDTINQSLQDKYKDLKGVTVTSALLDSKVEITTTIDFTQANYDDLVDAGLLSKGTRGNHVVSLKKSLSLYKSSGYSCEVSKAA